MTATALIAEDEPLLSASLQADLATLWPQLRIAASVGDGTKALQQALALKPALCFLDIRMPGMSGLEVAQALAEEWIDDGTPFPLLVFITAYEQYAVQGFAAQAVDYLLKPVERERLAQCCARLQRQLAGREATPSIHHAVEQLRALLGSAAPPAATPLLEAIQAGTGATVHFVPIDEVIYFEAADKYVRVVTADKEHLIRLSLRELLPQLDAKKFWQVHRGTVVQARMVTSAVRDESGKTHLTLRGRAEKLTASRLYGHLFKPM
jgi:DNA-binding LytR/AlgR family response regulator